MSSATKWGSWPRQREPRALKWLDGAKRGNLEEKAAGHQKLTQEQKMCASRESNAGLIDGNDFTTKPLALFLGELLAMGRAMLPQVSAGA
jgi:hypothetical protein